MVLFGVGVMKFIFIGMVIGMLMVIMFMVVLMGIGMMLMGMGGK